MKQTVLTPQQKAKISREVTNEATQRILNFLLRAGVKAWRHNVLPIPDKSGRLRPGSKNGVPDVLGIYGGRQFVYKSSSGAGAGIFLGVEIKKGRDRIRASQEGFHLEARKLGAIIITAAGDTVEEIFNSFLEQWKQITKTM